MRTDTNSPPKDSINAALRRWAAVGADTRERGTESVLMAAAAATAAGPRMAFFGAGRHLGGNTHHFARFWVVFIGSGIIFFHMGYYSNFPHAN